MRIHLHNAEAFIHTLASSITKDPAKLENWRCLHIKHDEELPREWYENLLKKMKERYTEANCDVVLSAGNDLLFISSEMNAADLYELAKQFVDDDSEIGHQHTSAIYDMLYDWRTIRNILFCNGQTDSPQPTLLGDPHATSAEIEPLHEALLEAKKRGKGNKPLRIMLVEGDPLAHQLAANTFKDNFALITAKDAQEAIVNHLRYAPDIVFLDSCLPDVCGFSLLKQILRLDAEAYVVTFNSSTYMDPPSTTACSG